MRVIEDSWIQEYLRFTQGQESPDLFHIWVALSIIAACLERNVKIDHKYHVIYPNLYVILVAGAGRCRKSSAISIGTKKLLSKIDKPPQTFAQKITNERLIQFLSEIAEGDVETNSIQFKSCGYIVASELSSFLGKSSMDSGIITSLTDLYDCPDYWSYETKGSGSNELNNVCLNLLGASTGKWLRNAIPAEAVGGGFISRTIFMYQDEPRKPIAFPEDHIPKNIDQIEDNLIQDLNQIRSLKGDFIVTPDAKKWYENWYIKTAKSMDTNESEDFFTRWTIHLEKLGMIISASRRDDLKITIADYKEALMYLEAVKASMNPVIDTMTVAESELPTSKILGVIRRRGTIDHERLAKYTSRFVKSEGLKQIIETLEEAGQIEARIKQGNNRIYKFTGKEVEDIDV